MEYKALSEISVENILKDYNLIVPEIQRDYVWGYNSQSIISTFMDDLIEGKKSRDGGSTVQIQELTKMIESPFTSDEVKQTLKSALLQLSNESTAMNIGFLYSYRPGYTSGSKDLDLYLIDGQQRFTTLFLFLFYFGLKEGRLNDFFHLFKINLEKGSLGFDYRVRNLTHQFFVELLTKVKNIDDLLAIRDKTWFLTNFSSDITVKSIVGEKRNNFVREGVDRKSVFELLHDKFADTNENYFDYLKTKVKFWHFKTEATSQGEELYITMNSRGQQLADNESLRARLFDSDYVRNNTLFWSEKWEQWQDFFWKSRNRKKTSADEGFNEFLRWVCIIEYIAKHDGDDTRVLQNKPVLIALYDNKELNSDYLGLDIIDKYFNIIAFLFGEFQDYLRTILSARYNFVSDLTQYFNKSHFIGGETKLTLSQNELFKLLPIIRYVSRFDNFGDIDMHQLFRFIKFVQNVSTDENVAKGIRRQLINMMKISNEFELNGSVHELLRYEDKYQTIINEEQSAKLDYYKQVNDQELCEDLFWYAESFEQSQGRISHLIELANSVLNDNYNLESFELAAKAHREFLDEIDLFLGNLIPTSAYHLSHDRITVIPDFSSGPGLMGLLYKRIKSGSITLHDFLLGLQKHFILQYVDYNQFAKELDLKKQLYIYYILKRNKLVNGIDAWSWLDLRTNFGIWSSYSDCKSIFTYGNIFQLIKRNFTENPAFILDVHFMELDSNNIFENLQKWAKS